SALDGRHRLKLDDLSTLENAFRGPARHVTQLVLAAPAVVLDVDRYPEGLALAARDDQVDQVLQAGELFSTAPDEHAEVVALHVQLGGFGTHGNLDGSAQVHEPQEFLE